MKNAMNLKRHSKKLWRMINNVVGKTQDRRHVISKLKIDTLESCNATVIVNKFAQHFGSIGSTFACSIPKSTISIEFYLNKINKNEKNLFLQPVNACEVKKFIKSLPNKTSSGWDGLSNKLIKSLSDVILVPLMEIINCLFVTGVFLDLMKVALVNPLYKSGSMVLCTNYRPISLLLILSKIVEKVMHSRLYNFLQSSDQIYQSQNGF